MDDRIREHAETLVDWSARIESGDNVVVSVDEGAHDLAVAVAEVLGERETSVTTVYSSEEVQRAYLRAHDGEFDEDPIHELSLYKNADSVLSLGGGRNTAALADVPGERTQEYGRAREGIREARLATDWVSTVHPTRALAQQAGMAYEEYEQFVYDAVSLDWEAQREFQAALVEILDDASEVRIEAGEETDVTMSVEGNTAANDYGEANLPGGEVFTAPVRDSVEGTVHFDLPLYRQGREVRDARLTFEDGEVVEFSAGQNEEVLAGVFDTDESARYLGELGIGMNDAIDRFTYNMLFDEKMGETVHMAVGSAYPQCVGEENEVNDSAEHVDMILDMSEDSVIEVDGEVVQKDGEFRF